MFSWRATESWCLLARLAYTSSDRLGIIFGETHEDRLAGELRGMQIARTLVAVVRARSRPFIDASSPLMRRLYQAAFLIFACLALAPPVCAQIPSGAASAQPSTLSDSPAPTFNQDAAQTESAIAGDSTMTALRAQLAKDPTSLPALAALAELLARSGHPRPAVELWRRAAALRPHDAGLQQALAQALIDAGRNRDAISILQAVAVEHPDCEQAQFALGQALARDGRFIEAIAPLETSLRLDPDEDAAELSMAKVLITLLRYDEAAPHVSKYARQHPDSFDAHYLLGLIASQADQFSVAERELSAAAALDPKNYDLQVKLGRVLAADGQPALAIVHLQAAVSLRPSAPETHYELSRVYHKIGDKPGSDAELAQMQVCRQEQAVDRQVTVLENDGNQAFAEEAYDKASQAFLGAIALHPAVAKLHQDLALAYDRLGREKDEQRELAVAVKLDPQDASIKSLLGVLAARAGETDRARSFFEQAQLLDPDDAVALCGLGVLAAQSGRLTEAEIMLDQSVESDPTYVEGYRDLGLVLAAEKRYPEAKAALHRSLDGKGNDAVAWIALGRLAMVQGDETAAVDAFRSALVRAPACSPERVEVARALQQESEYENALAALEPVGDGCSSALAAKAHVERSQLFCALKRSNEARAEWRTAQRLDPSVAQAGDFHCP